MSGNEHNNDKDHSFQNYVDSDEEESKTSEILK